MRRARAEDSFTWQPLDNGLRRRVAALVAVGLCSGLAGVAVGRMSSGAGVDGSHTPAIARPNDQIAENLSAPTQAALHKNHPASPPASPRCSAESKRRETGRCRGEGFGRSRTIVAPASFSYGSRNK
jgi:hypothetical protein